MIEQRPVLHISCSPKATVERLEANGWHLEIPAGSRFSYHLAQLDDHASRPRRNYPWIPPLRLSLEARVSGSELLGTWGFGLWNAPFSFLLGREGIVQRFPALPQAAWFFYASPQNYLSLRDDLPAEGFLAASFKSKYIPTALLLLASPILVLTLLPMTSRLIRQQLRRFIHQDASLIHTAMTDWHSYSFDWESAQVRFYLDGAEIFRTLISPDGPLSLVLWIDNQYLALSPQGRLHFGYLANPQPAWLEIRNLRLQEI